MENLKNQIKALAEELFPEIVRIRRHLHQHPELSYKEFETSRFVREILDENNIYYQAGFAGTGILARIDGKQKGGRVIALRADLDALPITEETGLEYASQNPGIMHACGHDAHAASLLGTAMIINKLSDHFGGTVLFIFQPAEEKAPGGAIGMLEEGLFADTEPDLILAQHVMPSMPAGIVGFRSGKYMASSDEIFITLKGPGGHAAMPHQTTDLILVASHILIALQQIVSRHAEASVPTVLSFGKLIADGAVNVIPSLLNMEGTFRTMNEEWRQQALERMAAMARSIASSMGAACEFNVITGYPALINDDKITSKSIDYAREFLGRENVTELQPRMTAEDFAHFANRYPATFYRLGVASAGEVSAPELHTPLFVIDEQALITGTGTLSYLALRHLLNK
jgi:amidohydrolase